MNVSPPFEITIVSFVKMYLDEAQIVQPPKEGWPHITPENLQGFGKTEEVLALLRHLPYIHGLYDIEQAQGAPSCEFADWESISILASEGRWEPEYLRTGTECYELYEDVPTLVVSLIRSSHNNDTFLVDTKLGIIHWYLPPENIRYETTRE
jgi:hypothetical protein